MNVRQLVEQVVRQDRLHAARRRMEAGGKPARAAKPEAEKLKHHSPQVIGTFLKKLGIKGAERSGSGRFGGYVDFQSKADRARFAKAMVDAGYYKPDFEQGNRLWFKW